MNTYDFNGLHILLTRPLPQVNDLAEAITQCNGHPIVLPTLAITAPSTIPTKKMIQQGFEAANIIIFISPNTVHELFRYTSASKLSTSAHFVVMGPSTQQALTQYLGPISTYAPTYYNSEGVLSIDLFDQIDGQTILLIKGEGGRDYLSSCLTERGAKVLELSVYQRTLPNYSDSELKEALLSDNIDVITITSANALQNLMQLAARIDKSDDLKAIPLIISSERLAGIATNFGFSRILYAENATNNALLNAIQQYQLKEKQMEQTESVSQQKSNSKKNNNKPTARRPRPLWPVYFFLVIALGIGGFNLFMQQTQFMKLQKRQSDNISNLQQSLDNNQQQFQQVSQQVTSLSQQQEKLNSQLSELTHSVHAVLSEKPRDRTDATLLQIQYQLRLANYQLNYFHQVKPAIILLTQAEQAMKHIKRSNISDLHKALSNDRLALQAAPHVDQEKLLATLGSLRERIYHLPLLHNVATPTTATDDEKSASENSWQWQYLWKNSWQQLRSLIVIRHQDQPIKPLLAPGQQQFLLQNMQLLLQQAEWAILRRDQPMYRHAINNTEKLIHQYYDAEKPATKAVLKGLSELSQQNIAPALPNINNSLEALDKLLKIHNSPNVKDKQS